MVNIDGRVELWPGTWKETRNKAIEIIGGLQRAVAERPLEATQLSEINSVISHIRGPWKRQWRNPVISQGIQVIKEHFSKRLSLDPTTPGSQYKQIFTKVLVTGSYPLQQFPELQAFTALLCYHGARRAKTDMDGADLSGLVNTAWRSPQPS